MEKVVEGWWAGNGRGDGKAAGVKEWLWVLEGS